MKVKIYEVSTIASATFKLVTVHDGYVEQHGGLVLPWNGGYRNMRERGDGWATHPWIGARRFTTDIALAQDALNGHLDTIHTSLGNAIKAQESLTAALMNEYDLEQAA